MKKNLYYILNLFFIVVLLMGCDNYSHNSYVNTNPANYFIVTMSKTIGGYGIDWGTGITPTADNGYTAIGTTDTWGPDSNSLYIVHVDSTGEFDWQTFYGGWGNDYGEDFVQIPSGDIIIVGASSSFELATGDKWIPSDLDVEWDYNFYLAKVNPDGITYWEKVFGVDSTLEWGKSIVLSADGVVLAGYQSSADDNSAGDNINFFVVKTSLEGNFVWQNSYGTGNKDYAFSLTETNDEGYIIVGYSVDSLTMTASPYVIKINSSGGLVWENTYGSPGLNEKLFSVIKTSDGGFVAVGTSAESPDTDPSSSTLYALKINSSGSVIWENIYPQSNLAQGRSVIENINGSLVVCGVGYQIGNITLTKLNPNGTLFWSQNTSVLGTGNGLFPIDGGYALTGSATNLANPGVGDLLIMEFLEDLTNIEL